MEKLLDFSCCAFECGNLAMRSILLIYEENISQEFVFSAFPDFFLKKSSEKMGAGLF